jgi:rhodanese-related sulfurtransferase
MTKPTSPFASPFAPNDPKQALAYFKNKMAFSTGPVETDHFWRETGGGFNLIDVRSAEDFHDCHLPGAVSLPDGKWETFEGLSKDKLNVVYCYSEACHLAAKACVVFAEAGYPVMEMDGGFAAWQENGLGIVREESKTEIDRDLKAGAA